MIHVSNIFGTEISVNQARVWLPGWFSVDTDISAYSFAMVSEGGDIAECFVSSSSFQVFLPISSIGKMISLSGSCTVLLK